MDERIIRKIDELVNVGVKDTYEMRRHLSEYVTREIFSKENIQPDPSNRRFYPKLSDIRSHMYCASIKNRFSKIDQENVNEQLKQWKASNPEDFFYFRPHGEVRCSSITGEGVGHAEDDEANKLLFVHQTKWQRRLLQRYRNEMCLLDATYKTTCYALPLFFETSHCIAEARRILQREANGWEPKFFMTDNSEQEITAIESVFPGM